MAIDYECNGCHRIFKRLDRFKYHRKNCPILMRQALLRDLERSEREGQLTEGYGAEVLARLRAEGS